MDYKPELKRLMVPKSFMLEAEKIFLKYSVSYLKNCGKTNQLFDVGQLVENAEIFTQARTLRLSAQILLKTLPDDMPQIMEIDNLLRKMDICKNALALCMTTTEAKL